MEFSNSHRNHNNEENEMDVDITQTSTPPSSSQRQQNLNADNRYDFVVVSSVGLHVEGPIPFINPEIPVEQHAILQIESNDDETETDSALPAPTMDSSRETSPISSPEENNQSPPNSQINENRKRSLSEDEDDGRLCPICLDNWTNTGDHRICALKCGHLFGYKCVNRWLDSQQKKSCPTCKKKVNRSDLRFIYAKKLVAVDTTELEVIKQELDNTLEDRNRILLDISQYVCREHSLKEEITCLKKQIKKMTNLRSDLGPVQSSQLSPFAPVRLYMDKCLEICRLGGCRVFDASQKLNLIVASMRSPTPLFAGYGLRKINIFSHFKPTAFVPLHSLQIRDVSFHPIFSWVLTASMDKSFKVVDVNTNSVLYTTSQPMPLWSCCWDTNNQYCFYIGTQSGSVVKYDVRNILAPLSTFSVPGDMSPVVSVASIPAQTGTELVNGGIISCKLNSLWVYENISGSDQDSIRHSLSLEGPFISMKYQEESRQILVSSRPNDRISYSRHVLCNLERISPERVNCNIVHSFQGGGMQKLLSKSCFLSNGEEELVAAHHETTKSVLLWSINRGQKVSSVPAHDAVLDLKGVRTNAGNFLVSLTEKKMEIFKFN